MKGIVLAGGARHAAVSPDDGDVEAASACLRQAHDLLSPVHPDDGGHPGHSHHLHPGGLPNFERLLGDGSPVRPAPEL